MTKAVSPRSWYEDVGSVPPVARLHGLLTDHNAWDRVLPLLPEGLRYLSRQEVSARKPAVDRALIPD